MTLGHVLVDAALDDLRLAPIDLKVFRVMWSQCDFENFHPKKAEVIAAEVGSERSYAAASLRKLVTLGYLEAGDRDSRGIGTYRLPRQAPAVGANSPTSVSPRRFRRQVRDAL